jgi:O-antigen/teichoic acid export membrane protein
MNNRIDSILLPIEKVLKTDIKYLLKGGFWATMSQLILSGASFLLAVAFAHFVSKTSYGQYKYILSIISILGTFTLSGLTVAVTQSVVKGYEGSLQYAFIENLKWSIIFFIGSLATGLYYILHHDYVIGLPLILASCLWPLFSSTNLYSPFLTAKKDFVRNALYFDITGNLIPFASLFVVMLLTTNPMWLAVTYIISNTIIGLILYRRILSIYKPNTTIDPELIHYGKHLSFMNILAGIANNIDQILVFQFIGPIQVALYNFATAIPNQIKGPVKNFNNIIFPKYTERDDQSIRNGMARKITTLLILGYIIIAPYLFKLFFPQYMEAVVYSQIFSLSVLWVISSPASTYLNAKKKIKEQYIIQVSSALIQILSVTVGVIYFGLIGLIIARVMTRLLLAVMTIVTFYRTTNS